MTLEEIQKRIDAMPAAMAAKGKRQADAQFNLRANDGPQVYLKWEAKPGDYADGYEFFDGSTIPVLIKKAEAWIAKLPSREETQMREFMAAVGAAIEKGKASGIDVDFVNPLVETMKRLSKNALRDQREPA